MQLDELNRLDDAAAARELLRCCGSTRWAQRMATARPFADAGTMMERADAIWWSLDAADWLDAFSAHPKIGGAATTAWSAQEQAGVAGAGVDVTQRLAIANRDYEARFGYIFIICATGKSAAEMLDALERRLEHAPDQELRIAAEEQRRITRLRLARLLDADAGQERVTMITTHVLDLARGGPAVGVTVILELRQASEWAPIGRGETDEKGRVTTLTPGPISPGAYRLTFDVAAYQREMGLHTNFFPEVRITFNVKDTDEHYHIPLLLSPFGYSTYRGT